MSPVVPRRLVAEFSGADLAVLVLNFMQSGGTPGTLLAAVVRPTRRARARLDSQARLAG